MAGSFCTVCRQRIAKGSRCSRHRTVSPSSRAWHERGAAELRKQLLDRPEACCSRCGSAERLELHHVIPARDGGPTVEANLAVLCHDCHVAVEAGREVVRIVVELERRSPG